MTSGPDVMMFFFWLFQAIVFIIGLIALLSSLPFLGRANSE